MTPRIESTGACASTPGLTPHKNDTACRKSRVILDGLSGCASPRTLNFIGPKVPFFLSFYYLGPEIESFSLDSSITDWPHRKGIAFTFLWVSQSFSFFFSPFSWPCLCSSIYWGPRKGKSKRKRDAVLGPNKFMSRDCLQQISWLLMNLFLGAKDLYAQPKEWKLTGPA